jgi:hypothetical protein
MSLILSLQGSMAVGKTTAVKYFQSHAPYINISYEENNDIVEQVKLRSLDKNTFEDYIEIQKLWIQNEIIRWEKAQKFSYSIMDFGAEEIEFYTLNYPKTIGVNWNVESKLHSELVQLRQCMPNRILYFDASEEVLRSHKKNDNTRSRTFFEHHLKYLLPLKREWFIGKENVDVLSVDELNCDKVGQKVKEWADKCITKYTKIHKIH